MSFQELLSELSDEIPDVLDALGDVDPDDEDAVSYARETAEDFLQRYEEGLEELDEPEAAKMKRTVGLQVEKIKGLLSKLPKP